MPTNDKLTQCRNKRECGVTRAILEIYEHCTAELERNQSLDIKYWADFHRGYNRGLSEAYERVINDIYQMLASIDEKLLEPNGHIYR